MLRTLASRGAAWTLAAVMAVSPAAALAQSAGPAKWQNDLTPIAASDWNYDFAAHLLERAGFGGTPEEIQALAKMTPAQAVARMVRFKGVDAVFLDALVQKCEWITVVEKAGARAEYPRAAAVRLPRHPEARSQIAGRRAERSG